MKFVALLRGINVGGHRKIPMADLRKVAADLGFTDVATYVASGNLVFSSHELQPTITAALTQAMLQTFGFEVDTIVVDAPTFAGYAHTNPFGPQSAEFPNLVLLSVGDRAATDHDVDTLRLKASDQEKVERIGDVIWFYFGGGSGQSKLNPNAIPGAWTTRNWRTVQKLVELTADGL